MYERHEWSSNESITSQKLNHLEEGIYNLYGGGVSSSLVVNVTYDTVNEYNVLDKTWQEIYDAFYAGSRVIIKFVFDDTGYDTYYVSSVHINGDYYQVEIYGYGTFYANSSDGYPYLPSLILDSIFE